MIIAIINKDAVVHHFWVDDADKKFVGELTVVPTPDNVFPNPPSEEVGMGEEWVIKMIDGKLTYIKTERPLTPEEFVENIGEIKNEIIQSDKVGFNFRNYYVNDILVRQDYVPQENPVGVAGNPFVYSADLILIPNGYYSNEGIVRVWMGENGVTSDWNDQNFVSL